MAHEDAIRLAHKSLRTAKAYMAEGMTHHAKALSLLDGVVDALDADPITDPPADPDPDANPEKTAQLGARHCIESAPRGDLTQGQASVVLPDGHQASLVDRSVTWSIDGRTGIPVRTPYTSPEVR